MGKYMRYITKQHISLIFEYYVLRGNRRHHKLCVCVLCMRACVCVCVCVCLCVCVCVCVFESLPQQLPVEKGGRELVHCILSQ